MSTGENQVNNVKPNLQRDIEDILARRRLLQSVIVGSLAFAGLAPILAMAKAPVQVGSNRKYCVEVVEWTEKKDKANVLAIGTLRVSNNDSGEVLGLYVLRGAFEDVFIPTVAINRSRKEVFAYANDLEFMVYRTEKNTDDEIFDEIIERARKEGKKKIVRYVTIMKSIKNSNPSKPEQ